MSQHVSGGCCTVSGNTACNGRKSSIDGHNMYRVAVVLYLAALRVSVARAQLMITTCIGWLWAWIGPNVCMSLLCNLMAEVSGKRTLSTPRWCKCWINSKLLQLALYADVYFWWLINSLSNVLISFWNARRRAQQVSAICLCFWTFFAGAGFWLVDMSTLRKCYIGLLWNNVLHRLAFGA